MPNWEIFHRVLECLYFLGGIVIAILAPFGLKQLALAKRSLQQSGEIAKLTAKREAYKLASESCHRYLTELIPTQNIAYKLLMESGFLDEMEKFDFKFNKEGFSIVPHADFDPSKVESVFEHREYLEQILLVANGLEAFAVPLMSGVASENVVFRSVGTTYCITSNQLIPFLLPFSSGGRHFENLIHLFCIWQQRIDLEELEKKKAELSDQINRKQDVRINPIGT